MKEFLATDIWQCGIVPTDTADQLRIDFVSLPFIIPRDTMEARLGIVSALSNKNTMITFQVKLGGFYWPRGSGAPLSYLLDMFTLTASHVYRLRLEGFSKIDVMIDSHGDQRS